MRSCEPRAAAGVLAAGRPYIYSDQMSKGADIANWLLPLVSLALCFICLLTYRGIFGCASSEQIFTLC